MTTITPTKMTTYDYLHKLIDEFHLSQGEIARRAGHPSWQSQISYVLRHHSGGASMYDAVRKLYDELMSARAARSLLGSRVTIRPGVGVSVPMTPDIPTLAPQNGQVPEPTLNRITLRDWLASGENIANRPRAFLAAMPNKQALMVERTNDGHFYLWVDTSQSDIPQDVREPAMTAREVRLVLAGRGDAALLDAPGVLFKR